MGSVLISGWRKIRGNVIRTHRLPGIMVRVVRERSGDGECIKTQVCLGKSGSKRVMSSASLSIGWCDTTNLFGHPSQHGLVVER